MTLKRRQFVADFETTTDPDDCRVWGFGLMNIFNHEQYKISNSLDEFMEFMERITGDIYFHNLKFDGSFIVNWLYRNGFTHSDTKAPGTFNTTISKMNQWYKIQIIYKMKGRRPVHTTIYDSLKKLPMTVDGVAKTYKLDTLKGSIDYTAYRPPDHEITSEEYDYIKNDVHIMAQALKLQFEKGLQAMTIGSDALKDFKEGINKKKFESTYPVLDPLIDEDIRKAYRGGFTWLNDKYKEKVIQGGLTYDVNSLYPFIMYEKELPWGIPQHFDGEYEHDPDYPLYIQHIRCMFEVKPDHIPTIQIKKNMLFKETEYLKSSEGYEIDLYVTNVDLALIKDHYDFKYIIYESGWKFKKNKGIFNPYIDKWTYEKMTTDGGERALAKLMLNSLYGKFATNPDVTGKIPELTDEGKLRFVDGEEETRDPVYTALGVFITSYAREYTIRTAQACYPRIIYCDTDSIHLEGTDIPETISDRIDDKALGYWAFEGEFVRGKYIRQKTYLDEIINDNGEIETLVKCAGMPDNIKKKVTFDNFKVGFESPGKLMPKQVPGGVILKDTTFTIM